MAHYGQYSEAMASAYGEQIHPSNPSLPRKASRTYIPQAPTAPPNSNWDTIQENPLALYDSPSNASPFAAAAAAAAAFGQPGHAGYASPGAQTVGAAGNYLRWEVQETAAADQVMVEPVIQAGNSDGDVSARMQAQMSELYDFFKKLHDKDQSEISNLQSKLQAKDKELKKVRSLSVGGARDQNSQQISRGGGLPPIKSSRLSEPAHNIVFLPYQLNSKRPLYRYYAYIRESFRQQRTRWLGIIWVIIFLIAVALLVGLLVPWHKDREKEPVFLPGNFTVFYTTPTSVSFTVGYNRDVTLYYTLMPSQYVRSTTAVRRISRMLLQDHMHSNGSLPWLPWDTSVDLTTLRSRDLSRVATATPNSNLQNFAVACGTRSLTKNVLYNISVVSSGLPPTPECSRLLGVGSTPPQLGACSICPLMVSGANYTIIIVGKRKHANGLFSWTDFMMQYDPNVPQPPPPPSPPPPPPSPSDIVPPLFSAGPLVTAAGEATLQLSFQLQTAGFVRFVVVLEEMFGRVGNYYATYQNGDPPVEQLLNYSNPSSFTSGIVLVGSIRVNTPGVPYKCFIGKQTSAAQLTEGAPGGCGCGTENPCVIPAPCNGSWCGFTPYAFTRNTTYRVYVATEAATVAVYGQQHKLDPVTTYYYDSPPRLANSTGVAPTIGPHSFSVSDVRQDKQGFVYVLVTQPFDQTTKLLPGSATTFERTSVEGYAPPSPPPSPPYTPYAPNPPGAPGFPPPSLLLSPPQPVSSPPLPSSPSSPAPQQALLRSVAPNTTEDWEQVLADGRQRMILSGALQQLRSPFALTPRLLQQTAAPTTVPFLPADPGGELFMPPCSFDIPCNYDLVAGKYVDPNVEALVDIRCLGMPNITQAQRIEVTSLSNDTLYRVKLVTMDLGFNEASYRAYVRTVDLTPPDFTSINMTTTFTSFTILVTINEPGEVASFAVLQSLVGSVDVGSGWPPTATGPVLGFARATVTQAEQQVSLTYDQNVTPNTDYAVFLLARDDHSNVQPTFTVIFVHTDDNIPPSWVQRVVEPQATSAALTVRLDEPAIVYAYWGLSTVFTACPTQEQMFDIVYNSETTFFASFLVPNTDPFTFQLLTLADSTTYRLCLIAQDTTSFRNRQPAPVQEIFTTKDLTPPVLQLRKPADGGMTCITRPPYTCTLTYQTGLNEMGMAWTLLVNNTAGFPPTPVNTSMLLAFSTSAPYLPRYDLQLEANIFTSTSVTVPSGTGYRVFAAAVDAVGNVNQTVSVLEFTAPHVTPPAFTAAAAVGISETQIQMTAQLGANSTVSYVIVPAGARTPSFTDVLRGRGSQDTAPTSQGQFQVPTPAIPSTGVAGGLARASLYDVHMVGKDVLGNINETVMSVRNVRTWDSTAPALLDFRTVYTLSSSNAYTISANATKPGVLYYLAINSGQPAPTRLDEIVQPTYGNFSGRIQLPSGYGTVSLCIADPGQLDVWGFVQDQEGLNPGRYPNNGTITLATRIANTRASGMCPSAAISSILPFRAGVASGSPGLPQGPLKPITAPNGAVIAWEQKYSALMMQPGGVAVGHIVPTLDGVPTPNNTGGFVYNVQGLPPSSATVVVRTPILQLEDSGEEGRRLSLVFQLLDSADRTIVNTDNLRAVAVVQHPNTAAVPFSACHLTGTGGIGICEGTLSSALFPGPGQATSANVVLEVYTGTALSVRTAPQALTLRGVPGVNVMTGPGVLASIPYRTLFRGEMFHVTLTAVGPTSADSQPITGFSIALQYNSSCVTYVRSASSPLWSDLVDAMTPNSNPTLATLRLTSNKRTGADNLYKGTAITLVDAFFTVSSNAPVGDVPLFWVTTESQLYPYGAVTKVQYNDYRITTNTNSVVGMVRLTTSTALAVLGYLPSHDIFNTAVFTNRAVSVPITSMVVNSWAATNASIVTAATLDACALMQASNSAFDLDGCNVVVRPSHSQPSKRAGVRITVNTPATLTSTVYISVWFPSKVGMTTSDATLHSLLPHNARQPPPGCTGRYQSTPITATASWSNGGTALKDTVEDTDITDRCSFSSSDESSAMVSAGTVHGLGPVSQVSISLNTYNQAVSASTVISVVDDPVCITDIVPVVASGFAITASATAPIDSSFTVTIMPEQSLSWEGASGLVRTIAFFSDGTTSDVTARSVVTLTKASPSFTLTTDPVHNVPMVTTTAQLGAGEACDTYLAAAYTTCSTLELGKAVGDVHVNLPRPTSIQSLTLSSLTIAPPQDGASQAPISLPASAAVRVWVTFNDGTVRDMTLDARTTLGVVAGSDLCSLTHSSSSDGAPVAVHVVASSSTSAAPGACTVRATVTVPGLTPLQATNTTQVITLTSMDLYFKNSSFLPPSSWVASQHVQAVPGVLRRMFRCSSNAYQQFTVWPLGRLSNCSSGTGSQGCVLLDLTSPAYTTLDTNDSAVASMVINPLQPTLRNRLVPMATGITTLTASFGSVAVSVPLSVEDTFLPTWPKVLDIGESSIRIQANMTAEFMVNYIVQPATQPAPNATYVERNGALLPRVANSTAVFLYEAVATGLTSATNYTVYVSVRAGDTLIATTTTISNVLTPDLQPPSLTRVGPIGNMDTGATQFQMQLPVAVNEPSTVSYAVYRNVSCRTGAPLTEEVLAGGATLPSPARCACNDTNDCAPVATGSAPLMAVLQDTLSIKGLMPGNPFDFLRTATPDQLVCVTVNITAYASRAHTVYIVAQDDMPTYKGWEVNCTAPLASWSGSSTECGATSPAPCTVKQPSVQLNNPQVLPYDTHALGRASAGGQSVVPGTGRPLSASFDLTDATPIEFTSARLATSDVGAAVRTITFDFSLNRPGLVHYRVTEEVDKVVYYGVQPVFDTTQPLSVSVKQMCGGAGLTKSAYGFWYWAVDVYGSQNKMNISSLNF